MKVNAVTIVVIAPIVKRNERLSCSLSSDAITAAWPEPMPGRKEQRGAAIAADNEDLRNCFFVNSICFNFGINCFVNFLEEVFSETIRVEEPNRPVKSGRSGSLIGSWNVASPRKPARRKIIKEERKLSSLKMR